MPQNYRPGLDVVRLAALLPVLCYHYCIEAARLGFAVQPDERALLREDMLSASARHVSLGADRVLKGAAGRAEEQRALAAMVGRLRQQAVRLAGALLPEHSAPLCRAPTGLRP